MKTAAEFQARLIEIQNEQKELIATQNTRLKAVRLKRQALTAEFYAVKTLWRETLGDTRKF